VIGENRVIPCHVEKDDLRQIAAIVGGKAEKT
jgi:hypothetical protein